MLPLQCHRKKARLDLRRRGSGPCSLFVEFPKRRQQLQWLDVLVKISHLHGLQAEKGWSLNTSEGNLSICEKDPDPP